jgi:hypothetical protein
MSSSRASSRAPVAASRRVPVDESGVITVKGMAWAGETLVLGGSFRGAVDFGTGVQQGPTEPYKAGFVLKLR